MAVDQHARDDRVGFSAWLRFGHDAIERNDPAEQESIIKFNTVGQLRHLPHALDMTAILRELAAKGWIITPAALGALSPYVTEPIKRFGEYATDGLTIPPAAFDPRLVLPDQLVGGPAAANIAA